MGEATSIEWTHHTFNPWWGCVKISDACKHCYAESLAKRYGHAVWGDRTPRRFFGPAHWREPLKWNRRAAEIGVRERVFCASMADVFEIHGDPDVDAEMAKARDQLWALIAATPSLDWLLLTKRPGNAERLVPGRWHRERPLNAWMGVTAEDQTQAELRIPEMIDARWPALRFVSYEPGLGAIDFNAIPIHAYENASGEQARGVFSRWQQRPMRAKLFGGVDWLIVGGESGPGARPFELAWARSAVKQARAAGIPVLVKQLGRRPVAPWLGERGDTDDWGDRLVFLRSAKGNDPSEWPEDLRVREFPTVAVLRG